MIVTRFAISAISCCMLFQANGLAIYLAQPEGLVDLV